MIVGDTRPLYAAIGPLHAEFPGWCFGIRPGHDGPRLEGYRSGCPAGLYAVITADPAEMRRELGALTPPRHHPQTGPALGPAAAPIRDRTRDQPAYRQVTGTPSFSAERSVVPAARQLRPWPAAAHPAP